MAAECAAAVATDVSAVDAALAAMEQPTRQQDVKGRIHSDLEFHLALAAAAQNPFLLDMLGKPLRPRLGFVSLRMLAVKPATHR